MALEARGRTGLLSAALWLPRSIRGERAKRAEASELIDFLGLGRYADTFVADLTAPLAEQTAAVTALAALGERVRRGGAVVPPPAESRLVAVEG